MKMSFLTASAVAVIALAACAAPSAPAPSPSSDAGIPSAMPSRSASPIPSVDPGPSSPVATPEPTKPAASPTPTPRPTAPSLTVGERYLLAGVRRGAVDCRVVYADLPPKSRAGIECAYDDPGVARVGFYLFDRDEDLLATYAARMIREGVALDSGPACDVAESEGPYVPWDGPDMAPFRYGCFVNAEGYANLRITTGSAVYIGILGRTDDMASLQEFAFRGSMDTPGFPTLWDLP